MHLRWVLKVRRTLEAARHVVRMLGREGVRGEVRLVAPVYLPVVALDDGLVHGVRHQEVRMEEFKQQFIVAGPSAAEDWCVLDTHATAHEWLSQCGKGRE